MDKIDIHQSIGAQVCLIQDQVEIQAREQVSNSVKLHVYIQVRNQVMNQVDHQVCDTIYNRVRKSLSS